MATRLVSGEVLAAGRSARAIAPSEAGSAREIAPSEAGSAREVASGRISVRCVAAEEFVREPGEGPFDPVFAVRVAVHGQPALAREPSLPGMRGD
ncbi:hypothetical protein KBY55_22790 [Streptomyces sp. b94]|uniref:hypothetical protein n=1 Tax=Streptomyces sp. b94 TaxID=1827634 RepID=UPI001B38C3EA|nr:hypothetical protein [Streptomyces sp. b94]MBQ1098816.1 hypothetical protein [Streptomyces sp. b94]